MSAASFISDMNTLQREFEGLPLEVTRLVGSLMELVEVQQSNIETLLAANKNARVLVDGAEVKRCVTADDRAGYVLAIAEDADGQVRLNAKRDGIVHQQIRGHVVIELQRV